MVNNGGTEDRIPSVVNNGGITKPFHIAVVVVGPQKGVPDTVR